MVVFLLPSPSFPLLPSLPVLQPSLLAPWPALVHLVSPVALSAGRRAGLASSLTLSQQPPLSAVPSVSTSPVLWRDWKCTMSCIPLLLQIQWADILNKNTTYTVRPSHYS